MKTLGILGGMSAESSILYYQKINQQVNQRLGGNHGAKLMIANIDFEQIAQLQKNGQWQRAGEILADYAKRLQSSEIDGLLLATNTMHKVADPIIQAIDVPFLHLVEITAQAIEKKGFKRVGLLGTMFSMTDGFYQNIMQKHGIEIIIPNDNDRQLIHKVIYDELCVGKIIDTSRLAYIDIIERLEKDGAEAVILGCTEIGLLVDESISPLPVFDTTLLHIDYAVNWLLEK